MDIIIRPAETSDFDSVVHILNQVQAMVDNVDETLGRAGFEAKQIEGTRNSSWVLMDYGDMIIHIFDEENRLFYDLERIWRDGKEVDAEEFLK